MNVPAIYDEAVFLPTRGGLIPKWAKLNFVVLLFGDIFTRVAPEGISGLNCSSSLNWSS
jgi:hypothetical protein